ncbi:unnamed protein product [Ectocarpus sp. CCAP 1310/34]|nr:unnamed protein product [Ectocarpus sp. CCAP 1310/34]
MFRGRGGIKYATFNDAQLLHKVVNGDLLGVKKELVNAGVSVNGNPRLLRDITLILTTVKGHIRIAEFLIARGANLESACLEDVVNEIGEMSVRKGTRALHLSSSPEITSVLLKAGACPDATDADGCTPLMLTTKDGKMTLHFAVGAGNIDAASCLLDAAPEKLNHPALECHITPLYFAAMGGPGQTKVHSTKVGNTPWTLSDRW